MHENFGCLVEGRRDDSPCAGPFRTLHHVRRHEYHSGLRELTAKNDFRSLILCAGHHLHGFGPHAIHTLTALGAWETFFGVNIEIEIREYNTAWRNQGHEIPGTAGAK